MTDSINYDSVKMNRNQIIRWRVITLLALVSCLSLIDFEITRNFNSTKNSESTRKFESTRRLMEANDESSKSVTIFYNVFLPENVLTDGYVMSIIEEQLHERKQSIFPDATVNYVILGKNIGELPNCENCKWLKHFDVGDEVETINILYDHCLHHPEEKVMYMHNKGSFHRNKANDLFRRMLTRAAFSKECLSSVMPPNNNTSSCDCNVCSSRFSPLPHFHSPGNMWVSRCSYINKLIPPKKFTDAMDRLAENTPREFGDIAQMDEWLIGRGRFSMEHWVNSHPSVCPCDTYPREYIWSYERLPEESTWNPDLKYAPRFGINKFEGNHSEAFQSSKYFAMAGRIHEWNTLYRDLPDKNSWVWKYYDGSEFYSKK